MIKLLIVISIFISASLSAQVKDSITTNWSQVGFRQEKDFTPFKESNWISIKVNGLDYDSIKVQYRINIEGIVQQRQRFYYTK